jgi:hypothetical protein
VPRGTNISGGSRNLNYLVGPLETFSLLIAATVLLPIFIFPGNQNLKISLILLALFNIGLIVIKIIGNKRTEALQIIVISMIALSYYWQKTTEWLVVNRDPGFYNLSFEEWRNNKFPIQVWPKNLNLPAGFQLNSGGFDLLSPNSTSVSIQGGIGYQKLGSVISGFFDKSNINHPNAILSVASLIVLYFFMKEFVDHKLALLGAIILGVSLPYIYISTSQFSETSTMLIGYLIFLNILRIKKQSVFISVFVIFILMVSVSTIRIDSPICILLPIIFYLTFTEKNSQKTSHTISILFASIFGTAIGQIIFINFSPAYGKALQNEIKFEWYLVIATLFLQVITILLSDEILNRIYKYLIYATKFFFIFLLFRPLYPFLTRKDKALINYYPEGKTYDENTLISFYWYYGPILIALLVYAVLKLSSKKSETTNPQRMMLSIFGTQLIGYFLTWNIAPDQPWASRRLVMFGYPILILIVLHFIYKTNFWKNKSQNNYTKKTLSGKIKHVETKLFSTKLKHSVVFCLLLANSLIAGLVFLNEHKPYEGLSTKLDETCRQIRKLSANEKPIILVGNSLYPLVQTFRTRCRVYGAVASEVEIDPIDSANLLNSFPGNNYKFIPIVENQTNFNLKEFRLQTYVIQPTLQSSPGSWDLITYRWYVPNE